MHQTYETKCTASSGRIIMRLINNNNSVSKLFRHWLARVRPAAVRWIYQTIELAILRTLAYTPLCPIDAPAGFFFCRNTNAGEADLTFRPKSQLVFSRACSSFMFVFDIRLLRDFQLSYTVVASVSVAVSGLFSEDCETEAKLSVLKSSCIDCGSSLAFCPLFRNTPWRYGTCITPSNSA